jgi:ferrous iron transport protein B
LITKPLHIALVGNPNTGKTTVFNSLTGLRQKVGNYPGVTVERKAGTVTINSIQHIVVDLPGTYSLNPKTLDETIAYETLIGKNAADPIPDLVLVILDASNLERNLYLATQVLDLGLPCLILLNMIDLAEDRGISVNPLLISRKLGVPVVPIVAKTAKESEKIKEAIASHTLSASPRFRWKPSENVKKALDILENEWMKPYSRVAEHAHLVESLRLLSNEKASETYKLNPNKTNLDKALIKARRVLDDARENWMAVEVLARYQFIGDIASEATQKEDPRATITDQIDKFVTHKILGPIIFVVLLLIMFQSIFSWAEPFMDLIDWAFVETGSWVAQTLPPGMLNDLLVEGVIAGLGGVIIFLPQIMFLFFFISILESSGYMARAAFVMDRFMTKIGLHGRSVVPLMSGFACAVPGIMATRTIENWRDRLITIMVLPFMACSARLPVYALMIAAFIPQTYIFGIIPLQGLTFFGLYLFGIFMAIVSAWVMKKVFKTGKESPFIMELPSYKFPKWSSVFHTMFDRGWVFVTEAGKIIMAISIVLWFLSSFPKYDIALNELPEGSTIESIQLKHSFAGQIGQLIEPVVKPLGFDWKIGIGLITSFAAREVMVGTLNTIYSIEDEGDGISTLKVKMANDKTPNGKPIYSALTAISVMIFFALAMQCMSTLAIVRRETNSWKWPSVMFIYMTTLAYLSSFITFQIGTLLGF